MNALSFLGRVLWILWLAFAVPQGVWALDGCRAADINNDGKVDQADIDRLIPLLRSASPCDLDGDGVVDDADVMIVLDFSGTSCLDCVADFSDDGNVGSEDRLILEGTYGSDCRPDLTRDGQVDVFDSAVLEIYAGGSPSPASERADLNGDAVVDGSDLSLLVESFGMDCRPDLNRDGAVNIWDLGLLHAAWGACPANSGDTKTTCDEGPPI